MSGTVNRLPKFRAIFTRTLRANDDVFYPHLLTFALGPHSWEVRAKVRDPDPRDRQAFERATRLVPPELSLADMRLVTVRPGDTLPAPGSVARFDDGDLEVLEYGQESDLSGVSLGVAVLRR